MEDINHRAVLALDDGSNHPLALPSPIGGMIGSLDSMVTNDVGNLFKRTLHPGDSHLYVVGQRETVRVMNTNANDNLKAVQTHEPEAWAPEFAISFQAGGRH